MNNSACFKITRLGGELLAFRVNEETTRKILINDGPEKSTVAAFDNPDEALNGVEWIADNPLPI